MFLTKIKKKFASLLTSITNYFSAIISFFGNYFFVYDVEKERQELNEAVILFLNRADNLLNTRRYVAKGPSQQNNSESPQSDHVEKRPSLEELNAVINAHNERSWAGRIWNYIRAFIRTNRYLYVRSFFIELKERLNQENAEHACAQFIDLCRLHQRYVGLEKDEYNRLDSTCDKIVNTLIQLKRQTARHSDIEEMINQLNEELTTDPEKIVFVSIIYYYSQIWYTYPEVGGAELKAVQELMKLKLHPDKNPEHQKEAANNAYLRFCDINETERHGGEAAGKQDTTAYQKYVDELRAINKKKFDEEVAAHALWKAGILAAHEQSKVEQLIKRVKNLVEYLACQLIANEHWEAEPVFFRGELGDKLNDMWNLAIQQMIDTINNNKFPSLDHATHSRLIAGLKKTLELIASEQAELAEQAEYGLMEAAMANIMKEVIETTIDAINNNSFVFREGIGCYMLLIGLKVLEGFIAAKQNNVTDQEELPQQQDEVNEDSDSSSMRFSRV